MSLRARRPETKRIDLSDGEWILVKKHLTAGEQRSIFRRMMREGMTGDQIDSVRVGWSKMVGYLLDWSATDADNHPIVIRDRSEDEVGAALDALDVDSFREILTAIESHEAEMDRARAEEKKILSGALVSSRILPSPSTTAGATSGSLISPLVSTTS